MHVFDYRDPDIVGKIVKAASADAHPRPTVPLILDTIGSKSGSLKQIADVAEAGAVVAMLLPVIVKDATDIKEPVYSMEAEKEAAWRDGVVVRGVRTHFYLQVGLIPAGFKSVGMADWRQNELFKKKLQPEIMPTLLAEGIVKPNRQKIVEGATMVERAQKAIDMLRRKEPSGERLVWRVAD